MATQRTNGYNLYYSSGDGDWEIIPGDETSNCFETVGQAEEAIDSLRSIDSEWAGASYDVRPCTHPRHSPDGRNSWQRESANRMIVTEVYRGVWACHEEGQRPVEGVGVYHYPRYWQCDQHGVFTVKMLNPPCVHVLSVMAHEAKSQVAGMKHLTVEELRSAWWTPGSHEDPDVEFDRRLEAVQEAVLVSQAQTPHCANYRRKGDAMKERVLGDGKTIVHDEAYIALRRSVGKGGRLVFITSNELYAQETPLARVHDYERFLAAWKGQDMPPTLAVVRGEATLRETP